MILATKNKENFINLKFDYLNKTIQVMKFQYYNVQMNYYICNKVPNLIYIHTDLTIMQMQETEIISHKWCYNSFQITDTEKMILDKSNFKINEEIK